MTDEPYNPLHKDNLARSIEREVLSRAAVPLNATEQIKGAGIYVIYYLGKFAPYAPISGDKVPIYVGKAIPKGGRKGALARTLEGACNGR